MSTVSLNTASLSITSFNETEKVGILLHEYDSLRREIHTRTANLYQVIAVAAALAVWLLGRDANIVSCAVGAAAFGAILYLYAVIRHDIRKAAARVRELEQNVNRRAGEQLLDWETVHGGAEKGRLGGPLAASGS